MFVHRFLISVLVAVLTVTGLSVSGPYAADAADANGDHCIDVLDVQTVVAAVLGGSRADGALDVNADDQVDVLDLQFILARATYAHSTTRKNPVGPKPGATMPLRLYAPTVPIPERRSAFLLDQPETQSAFHLAQFAHFSPVPRETERYLFSLTPHAPPTCA